MDRTEKSIEITKGIVERCESVCLQPQMDSPKSLCYHIAKTSHNARRFHQIRHNISGGIEIPLKIEGDGANVHNTSLNSVRKVSVHRIIQIQLTFPIPVGYPLLFTDILFTKSIDSR